MSRKMPGETYADFAAALREVIGKNKVRKRVLLAQLYRCLDKTTKKLVWQSPKPKTLERAVAKATKIDDPMENVAGNAEHRARMGNCAKPVPHPDGGNDWSDDGHPRNWWCWSAVWYHGDKPHSDDGWAVEL